MKRGCRSIQYSWFFGEMTYEIDNIHDFLLFMKICSVMSLYHESMMTGEYYHGNPNRRYLKFHN